MVTFDIKMEMDPEEWHDHCWGSGWTTWDWWHSASVTDEGIRAAWYDDADDPDSTVTTRFLTFQEIADKCSEFAALDPFVARQLQASDFDADGMDRVMQYAFIGEVRYG
jgi:hypothetical protein